MENQIKLRGEVAKYQEKFKDVLPDGKLVLSFLYLALLVHLLA